MLDREFPGWATRINTESLDQSSCMDCVLGQTVGGANFYGTCLWLSGQGEDMGNWPEARAWAIQHGFWADYDVTWSNYGSLTRLWREQIACRTLAVAA